MERGTDKSIHPPGELYFLAHPGSEGTFSGYGLSTGLGRIDRLAGLLLVDRPQPVDPAWLAEIEDAFGEYSLTPMTETGERGIACQMRIEPDSLQYLQQMPHPLAGEISRALQPLLDELPRPAFKLRWDEERSLWTSRLWIGLPPELEDLFERTGPGCLALLPYPRHRGASDRGDIVAFVTHASDADIESFRGAPVLFRWELIELPSAPVVRFRAAILDDPRAPFFLEHFLNVEDPDQARCLTRLVEQEMIAFDFFGDDYEYAYSKLLHHPEDMRAGLGEIAARAEALLEQTAAGDLDFDRAKAELQAQRPKFDLGQVVATPGALEALQNANVPPGHLLSRHLIGDWGDLCQEDWQLNDEAVHTGERIFSAYQLPDDIRIWVITEWDRSATTLLLPSEY